MKRIMFLFFIVLIGLTSNKLKGQTKWYNLNESNVVNFLNEKNPNGMISESYDTIREIKMYKTTIVNLVGTLENKTTHEILFLKGLPIVLSYYNQMKERKWNNKFIFFNESFNENGYLKFKKDRNTWKNENYLINNESEYKTKRMISSLGFGITLEDSGTLKKSEEEIIMTKSLIQYRIEYVMEQIKKGLLGGKINISEINYYDINNLIDIFISDLFGYSKKYFTDNFINRNKSKKYFEFLKIQTESKRIIDFDLKKEGVLGISKSIYDDSTISISINPILWKISSNPKRLYILYHELGHDILNFIHGEGGKMMFTISDSDYNVEDLYIDREYMFESFIDKKLKLGFKSKPIEFEDKFLKFTDDLMYYKNILLDGRLVDYNKEDKTWGVYEYKSGKLVYVEVYDSSKENLLSEMGMKNNLPHGVMKTYFKSGKLESIVEFINGTSQGGYILYNEDGSIKYQY